MAQDMGGTGIYLKDQHIFYIIRVKSRPSAFHLMSRTYSQTAANFKASLVPKEALIIWEHNGI